MEPKVHIELCYSARPYGDQQWRYVVEDMAFVGVIVGSDYRISSSFWY